MLVELMTIAIFVPRGYANDRLQSEILERQKSEQILRSIGEGTVSVTGIESGDESGSIVTVKLPVSCFRSLC
jgi:ArsR family metal-binding transcriptional regulator